MSKCISNWGEFSEHEYTGENATCDYCGQVSEMIAVDQLQTTRAALVAIQELHHLEHEVRLLHTTSNYNSGPVGTSEYRICANCKTYYPCPTRRLADDALGGGQDG